MITTSPAVSGGLVYTGVASNEEGLAGFVPGFVCCKARGSVVAVNATTGDIEWKTYTVPTGYSGGGVWGSNFVVDSARGTVFVGTGNNYSHPTDPAYVACIAGGGTAASCASPANHVDSILALDLNTGAVKWAKKFVTWTQPGVADGSDDWNVCLLRSRRSPTVRAMPAPTTISRSAPNLITYQGQEGHQDHPRRRTEERHLLRARSGHRRRAVAHAGRPGVVAGRHGVGFGERWQAHLRADRQFLRDPHARPAAPVPGPRSTPQRARSCGRWPIPTAP